MEDVHSRGAEPRHAGTGHLRRDTTYAEDASRLRAGDAPRLFASIASLAVSVLNRAGLTNHAAARRDLGWDRTGLRALGLLGL